MSWIESGRAVCLVERVGQGKAITAIDVSAFTNKEIAKGIGWTGNPDQLVSALIESGWMTPDKILLGNGVMSGHAEGITFQRESIKARRMRMAPRKDVFDRDGRRCVYCGSRDNLTLDHVVPYSLGGDESMDNLVTCCRSCNSRKGARTPEEAGMIIKPLRGC